MYFKPNILVQEATKRDTMTHSTFSNLRLHKTISHTELALKSTKPVCEVCLLLTPQTLFRLS